MVEGGMGREVVRLAIVVRLPYQLIKMIDEHCCSTFVSEADALPIRASQGIPVLREHHADDPLGLHRT